MSWRAVTPRHDPARISWDEMKDVVVKWLYPYSTSIVVEVMALHLATVSNRYPSAELGLAAAVLSLKIYQDNWMKVSGAISYCNNTTVADIESELLLAYASKSCSTYADIVYKKIDVESLSFESVSLLEHMIRNNISQATLIEDPVQVASRIISALPSNFNTEGNLWEEETGREVKILYDAEGYDAEGTGKETSIIYDPENG